MNVLRSAPSVLRTPTRDVPRCTSKNNAGRSTQHAGLLLSAPIQSALHPAGRQAAKIAHLHSLFTWLCIAIYVIVVAFVIAAYLRGHRNASPQRDDTPGMKRAVSAAAAITIVTLLLLVGASAATGHDIGTFAQNAPARLEIDVIGHQWWWEVHYPDALVPSRSFVTANEIHIPTHTPVLLRLATRDVIHSLWIPGLHGKRDLIPGRNNKLSIEADEEGIYRGQCAEFCGLQHAHMALIVTAESPAAFERWKSLQQRGGATPATPDRVRGQQVFLSAPCANCHNIEGSDASATLGPDLTHIASRSTLGAGTLMNNRGNLAGWIANAQAIKPGAQMPPNELSAQELHDLTAYLESLK